MKKNYKLILLLFAVAPIFPVFSQIQLSPGDIIHPGSFNMTIDSSGSFNEGQSGANRVWDFRSLASQLPFDYQIAAYKGYGNGNDANLVKISGIDTYSYFLQTSSAVYNITPLQDFDKVSYQKLKLFNCPLQYQAVNGDSFETISYYPGYLMGMSSQDSVRLTFKMANTSAVDAWGVLRMPSKDYNVLRILTRNTITLRIAGKKGSNPYTNIPGLDRDEIVNAYTWYAKDLGTYLATYNPDDGQVEYLVSSTLAINEHTVANSISFPNPCTEELAVTNNSGDNFRMALFDMQGKLVLDWDMRGNSRCLTNISALPGGFYTLQMMNTRTHAISYEKVVKQ